MTVYSCSNNPCFPNYLNLIHNPLFCVGQSDGVGLFMVCVFLRAD